MGQSPRQGLGVGTNGADLVSPPLVSLLIINWNYGTYIGATIDSIKSQDYPAIEVIVVDNGSTDDSRDVIGKHAGDDPRFRVVHLDENLGQLGAYFYAFELTSGETIVDADDILFPSFVSSHVQVHLALPSSVALTSSNVVEISGEGRALTGVYARFGFGVKPATRGLRPADVAPRLRTVPAADYSRLARSTSTVAAVAMPWFWAPGSSNMFRRSVLAVAQQQRKNRVYMRAADNYLNPLCHALGGTALIDVQLSAYRIHGSNYFAVRETVGVLRPGRADFNARVQQENRDLIQFLLERAWLLETLRGSRFWPLLRQLFEQVADRDRFFASPDTLALFIDYYPNLCQISGERRLLAELRRLLGLKGLRTVLRAVHGGRIPLRLRVVLLTERGKTATVAARRIVLKVGRAAASKMARLPSKNISAAKTLAPPKARTKTETETDEHNPQDFGPVAVLSADPPIFLTGMAFQSMIGIAPAFARSSGSRPAAFLIYPCWTIEDRYRSAEVIAAARAHRDEHPEHELLFLCNSAAETEALASGGLNAQLLNKNFTVSDTVFRPLAEAQVEFDAVYNARFDPRKRHDLASAIERVAYLGYPCLSAGPYEEQSELAARLLRQHPGHALLYPIEHGLPVRLPPESVNAALNRAAVGLCLSSVEGSNYASVEYMLAGLPVVSTPSVGGRDIYFDHEFCTICDPDPIAVRDAVRALKARNIPRDYIRARTLAKLEPARRRFLSVIDDVSERLGGKRRYDDGVWPFGGISPMVTWRDYREHLQAFAEGRELLEARRGPSLEAEIGRLLAGSEGIQMQPSELGAIVQAVRSRPGCSLLVFGCAGGCVFVHDCERLPEQNYAARYLGSERLFLKVEGHAVLHGYAF